MKSVLRWLFLLLGIAAITSSWFSVRPAAEHRYRELLAREARLPDSVSADEWIMNESDEGMSAIALIFVGIPAFIAVTIATGIGNRLTKKRLPLSIAIGTAWIFLGGVLHTLVWYGL